MYKVLLVDDEVLVREAISSNINWNSLGYELIGSCKNGKDAKEFLIKNTVDLLITDVCMPFVDGLELSKYVYENFPDIRVVILSGYSEFEYAKKAVKYRVLEYLLKPVTASELSEILLEIKKSIIIEMEQKDTLNKLENAYEKNLFHMRTIYLGQLLSGEMKETSHDRITSKLKEYNLDIPGPYYKALLVNVDNTEAFLKYSPCEKKDLPEFITFNILEELATTYPNTVLFQDNNNYTVILMGYETEEELKNRINTLYNKCNDILQKSFGLSITIGIGHTVKTFLKLSYSYEGARSALLHSFLYGGNQILDIKKIAPKKKNEQIDLTEDIKNLTLAIRLNNKEDMDNSLHIIMNKFRDSIILKDAIQVYIQTIVFSLDNLMENVIEFDHNFILKKDELLQCLYKENTLLGIEKTIANYCIQMGEILSKQRDKFDKKQAILAKEYINTHYSNPDLTLQSICNHLSISVSYFSAIFKSFTGETFIESLTKKRIEKAMDLLTDTSLKIYEIAEKVGFSDPQYFATTFKKYTGKTPKSFTKERLHMYGKI